MAHSLRSPRLQKGERKAVVQEMLYGQHLYRQNAAMHHGLDPGPPVILGDDESDPVDPDEPTAPQMYPAPLAVTPESLPDPLAVSPTLGDRLKKWLPIALLVLGAGSAPVLFDVWRNWGTEDSAADIVEQIENLNLGQPTDLGENIQRAFDIDPAFREEFLGRVQATVESDNAGQPGGSDPAAVP